MWRKIIRMYAPAYFWLPFFLAGFWWKGSLLWEISFVFIIKWWRCCLYQQSPGAKLRWWKSFQKQTSIHLQKSHVFKPTSVSLVSPPTDQKEVKVQVRVFLRDASLPGPVALCVSSQALPCPAAHFWWSKQGFKYEHSVGTCQACCSMTR